MGASSRESGTHLRHRVGGVRDGEKNVKKENVLKTTTTTTTVADRRMMTMVVVESIPRSGAKKNERRKDISVSGDATKVIVV